MTANVVFFVDVDNTMLDNDRIIADLRRHLAVQFGPDCADRYWANFDKLRDKLGYADYLGALQRYRAEIDHHSDGNHRLFLMSSFLVDYPFADRLYPLALDVLHRLRTLGPTVILTDGDVVFQPRKVQRSGLWDAVDGEMLIYVHKESMLDDLQRLYPARRYVMVDDKLRILAAMKAVWGKRLLTVFARQGHYAHDEAILATQPAPDLTVERIGDLLEFPVEQWLGATTKEKT